MKTIGFLFVFLRRESRTRYEDFCEEERERYVADRGRAIQKRLDGASALAFLLLPQPFFAGPHRNLCPRGKA